MGFLGPLGLGGILTRLGTQVICAVEFRHASTGRLDRLLRQVYRVGSHIGDIALLVETLGRAHGVPGREPQFAVRLLLQGGGGEGRRWLAGVGSLLNVRHCPIARSQAIAQGLGLLFVEQNNLFARRNLPGGFVKIRPRGQFFAVQGHQLGFKGAIVQAGQRRLQVPIGSGFERSPGPFPNHQHPHRHGLHPPCRQARRDFFPQQRRQGVTHQAIENSAGFLGMNEVIVHLATVLNGRSNGLFRNFMEDHSFHGHFRFQNLQ